MTEKLRQCYCASNAGNEPKGTNPLKRYVLWGVAGLASWIAIYASLPHLAKWFAYSLLALEPGRRFSSAVEFFLFETPKVLLLLVLVVFGVGIIRSFFSPERTRRILAGKKEFVGNILAAFLGVVTPFCTCSAIPLFIGFVTTGIPLGVTFSFLISAPMVNEIALVLLFGLFGWKVALLYMSTGLFISILSGWIIGRLRLERYVEEWVYKTNTPTAPATDLSSAWVHRIEYGANAVKDIVGKV